MKLPWLTSVIDESGPFVSVHLDTTRTDPQSAGELEARWAQMRSRLAADGAPQGVLEEIEDSVLSPSRLGGRHGRSVFATDKGILVDRVLPAPPLAESARRGEFPQLLPLLQLIPNFWLALLLVILFSVNLGWLPAMGIGGIEYYILPAMAGATNGIATLARQTRSSMLDVIRSDYITTARAKGVPEIQVILKHALKNGLIPIITVIGTQFGKQLGGTMVIETIFAIPGMGQLIISAVNSRDYPVVQSGSIFLAIVFSLCMLVVDLLYAAVDPRIKAQYSKGKVRKKAKVVTANG